LRSLLKARLALFILKRNLLSLLTWRMTFRRFVYSLRKQIVFSSPFKDAKYSRVGSKIFIDPFAPFFPSPFAGKLFDNNSVDTFPLKPNYAQISITNFCPCRCIHCHVENSQEGDMPREAIFAALQDMVEANFPLIFFVGGEPMSRFADLVDFVAYSRRHMDTRIFTSGVGASVKRLRTLKEAGLEGICVSLDHHKEAVHNRKRNHPAAFQSACATIQEASNLGFYVSVVCCTTSPMVTSGETFQVVDLAERLGAHSIQINEIRPVGRATKTQGEDLFLSSRDKEILIDYYRAQNRGTRRIAVVMPWYNEEPYNFGCTATSGQQAYVDAKGNVMPCPLLKMGFGNINEDRFKTIWNRFTHACGHPVRECILYPLFQSLSESKTLPIPVERSFELWPEVCAIEKADMYKRIEVKRANGDEPAEEGKTRVDRKYDLDLAEGVHFAVKRNHWLPRKLGVGYLAFGKTLYCKDGDGGIPRHEYLHLAQFHRYGIPRVLFHYLYHFCRSYWKGRDFAKAFQAVPFEVEARAFEAQPEEGKPA
jgi:MoaA/NifB/PqqE/SkfB family radical SAM enzyme